ncbi:MAG: hypothetical protein JNN29_12810 [Chitinophagaceae bacterium]|nr:hypothetical protein [Chitinophagaceae bacterium]
MSKSILYTCFICILVLKGPVASFAQDLKPDIRRALYHDFVDKQQTMALAADGQADRSYKPTGNEEIDFILTDALVTRVDALQYQFEKDSIYPHPVKVRYIRGLEEILKNLNTDTTRDRQAALNLPRVLATYEEFIAWDRDNKPLDSLVESLPYAVALPLVRSAAFDLNPSIKTCRQIIIRKYCELNPSQIFFTLRQYPDLPYADSLIKVAAYRYPMSLYDYASANNALSARIRKLEDPLISTISRMAVSGGSGQLYFPFLDNIIKGKVSQREVDAVKNDAEEYYKLLVRTRIDYVERAIAGDTTYGFKALADMLKKKATDVYINVINGLHDQPDAVRFRVLQSLNAQELYYLAVLSDGEIYTSSYVKGVYPLMMAKVNHRPDSLLKLVRFDKFRKFIKMAAGYNTLSDFLGAFPDHNDAQTLMTAFVNGLENGEGLEEGVDVADSYGSISETNKTVAEDMVTNVKINYRKNFNANNRRGMVIYDLLYKLFLSADSTKPIDLSKELGIPPVYTVNYDMLSDDSARVIQQVFFYGDEDQDGQLSFINFMAMFKGKPDWSISENDYWVTIKSVKGKSVWIFANKPKLGDDDPDEQAQIRLGEYLKANNLHPTVVIHRGHSYHLPSTLEKLAPSAGIVVLGSCGGYNNLNDVLSISSDAHIISSKQVGTKSVNEPILEEINNSLLAGKDIDWIGMWQRLSVRFSKNAAAREKFDDYIPPYKNLGAIFIKGYRIAMAKG